MRTRWDKEMIAAEASKYRTIEEFLIGCRAAYSAARRRGILADVTSHMVSGVKADKKWNNAILAEVASSYTTRGAFLKGNSRAYSAARKRGILDQICSHMEKVYESWSYDSIKNEALKYTSRKAFAVGNPKAYGIAVQRGIINDVCSHAPKSQGKRNVWTNEAIRNEALKYKTRPEFLANATGAYMAARRRGIHEDVCSHMTVLQRTWSNDELREEALKYKSRSEMRRYNDSAYVIIVKRGLDDVYFSHMEWKEPSDSNAVYIWRLNNTFHNGDPVYKIGITSARLGDFRISVVSKKWNIDAEIVLLREIVGNAKDLERKLLKLGRCPGFSRQDGYTEMRAMTDSELATALLIVEEFMNVETQA